MKSNHALCSPDLILNVVFIKPLSSKAKGQPILLLLFTRLVVSNSFRFSILVEVQLFVTLWTAACQASLSFIISWNVLKLKSIESMMPSNYLILCHPLLFLPSIFPSIRVFSNESALCIKWPNHWSFSFSINPFNEYLGLISFRIDWFDLLIV